MKLCVNGDYKKIIEYIGEDYVRCAYLYIDLIKYGFENENVKIWWELNDKQEVQIIALKYYNGMHLYSRNANFNCKEVVELVTTEKPELVCGVKSVIEKISNYCNDYEAEYGKVLCLENYTGVADENVYRAKRDELKEIVELLMTDEEMGGPYTFDLLYHQFLERFDSGYGRNWVRKDKNGVVSHCATYAENDKLAVISGGIVRIDSRGKGLYPGQLGAMCRDLFNEGKKVISYYYGVAQSAHRKVGFEIIDDWVKLIRKKDK